MRVDLLASGSKGNCCVVRDGTTCLLIDCGSTKKYLSEALAKTGVSHDDIDALLITHDHSDHISQIRMFADLPVYAPIDLPETDIFHVRPMQKFTIETLEITPLALSHDAPHTTGYILSSGQEKLVYITDTGYVNQRYFPLLRDADTIVMESNHDVQMLMHTRRPQYVKARIYSDEGHLNNEDCAEVLNQIVTPKTKTIFLAHISQQGNTREKALEASVRRLSERTDLNPALTICAAGQFEILTKGESDEEMDYGTVYHSFGMGCRPECEHLF
jgi:phosphoribosyl 1,2-cyclic phosphodiesterase